MARTVEDMAYALEVIAGPDPQDPTTSQKSLPRYSEALRREVRGLKAAVVKELLPGPSLDPEVEQGVRRAIAVLEGLGMIMAKVSLPIVERAGLIYIAFGEPEAAVSHLPFLRVCPARYGYTARVRMATGLLIPGAFALAGVPALAVPCGFARTGLPLSMQLIAKPWRDDLVLQVGHAYRQATAWHTHRPRLPDTDAADPTRVER